MNFIDNLNKYYFPAKQPESLKEIRDGLIENWIDRLWDDGFSGNADEFTAEAEKRTDEDIAEREQEIEDFPKEFEEKLSNFKKDLDKFLSRLDTNQVEISIFQKTHFPSVYKTVSENTFSEVWNRANVKNHILDQLQDTRRPMQYVSFALQTLANQL